jgi:osmotically-inducible protein OsmY
MGKSGFKAVRGLTAMLAASGLIGGCAVSSKCELGGCPGDAQITAHVESLFGQHPELGTEIGVQTQDHVVYLSGFVSAGEMRATADDVARTAPGVTRVVDTIAVTK